MDQPTPLKNTVIIYHADCPDGFGAAWAAWKRFGDIASYLPAYHRTEPPAGLEGKEVYTIDYSYSPDQVKKHAPLSKKWVIIDHHITNEPTLPLASEAHFDLTHSGAYLAWTYFHSEKPVPKLIQYVEAADLWNFELPFARELDDAIHLRDLDFLEWDTMAREMETESGFAKLRSEGELLRKANMQEVARLVKHAEEVTFEGYQALMVNSPAHVSELGAALYTQMPPIAIIWSRRGKKVIVSLRSDGSVDVAKIAQMYGGGGHAVAAGFSWEVDTFLAFQKAQSL